MKKSKNTIRKQISIIIAGLMAGTVLLCWLLNATLAGWYYTRDKQKVLQGAFDTINEVANNDGLASSQFDIEFEKLCSSKNIDIIIIKSDHAVVRSSSYYIDTLLNLFWDLTYNEEATGMEIISGTDNYTIGKVTDTRMKSEYLVLVGALDNGNPVLIRVALESIQESVAVFEKLLAFTGIFAVIISIILVYFVTRRITEPIVQLTDISERMAQLDFDVKYQVTGDNEIEQLGAHINQLSTTLEKTISELKSANNELQMDIVRKERIDEMRKDFLSNVSHELKTPLALIQGYAEGLQECVSEDPDSRRFYTEVIIDEADKMNQLVKKLLTLNQLEFGNEVVTVERFDLTELVHGVINNASILLEQNEIMLHLTEVEPLYVWADEFKIEEVLTNYLSNAIHHCDGERRIEISYLQKAERVRVNVFNTGAHIPVEDIEKIWVKFYKVDKARTREYGGSGIGLSIVKAIMESLHQECGVENTTDGVLFWFELDTKSN